MASEMIISNLRRFNRKESYHLTRAALNVPEFRLDKSFRKGLKKCLSLPGSVPEDAFVAMEYHLDWVYSSLFLADKGIDLDEAVKSKERFPRCDKITGSRVIMANREDIDLLIAYRGDKCHLLFLEAKGDDSFTNKQLNSKADRLKGIFGECGDRWDGVTPHFALISPKKPDPKKLDCKKWPKWMRGEEKPAWVELPWCDDLVRIERCNESGEPDEDGAFWMVKKSRYFTQTEDKT